jgi:hypothetical protein
MQDLCREAGCMSYLQAADYATHTHIQLAWTPHHAALHAFSCRVVQTPRLHSDIRIPLMGFLGPLYTLYTLLDGISPCRW